MIATYVLLCLTVIATITDVSKQKIYNWTTYSGIVIALILSGGQTLFGSNVYSEVSLWASLAGLGACGGIMLICFLLFQIGGGDVKLLAMMGAFLGLEPGIETLLWTFVIGGAMALVILIWKIGVVRLFKRVVQQLMCRLGVGIWDDLSTEEKQQLKIPLYLAPAALAALLIVQFKAVEFLF